MNLNFESWFQFSDMYELIRFMYKYIWQVQKFNPENELGNFLDFYFLATFALFKVWKLSDLAKC